MPKYRITNTGGIGGQVWSDIIKHACIERQTGTMTGKPNERRTTKGHMEAHVHIEIPLEDIDDERVKEWVLESLSNYYKGQIPLVVCFERLPDDSPLDVPDLGSADRFVDVPGLDAPDLPVNL